MALSDVQLDRRHGALQITGNADSRVPNQVVFAAGNRSCVAAVNVNGKLVGGPEAALQINTQRQGQRIEGGSEIGTGCGNPQFAKGQTAILTRISPQRP